MRRPVILTVGANPRNLELLERFLGEAGYQAVGVTRLEELDELLAREPSMDLALVDVSGFGAQVWERCKRLHEQGIPHLVISGPRGADASHRGAAGEARAVFEKPIAARHLLGVVRDLLGAPAA